MPPRLETVNDTDGRIVKLFRVLRNPDTAAQLAEAVALTPYAIDEFREARTGQSADPIEDARRFLVTANCATGPGGFGWSRNIDPIDRLFEALVDVTTDPFTLLLEQAERDQALEPILRTHGLTLQIGQPTGPKRDLIVDALELWIDERRDPGPIAAALRHLVDALRHDTTLPVPVRWLQLCAINHAARRR